MQGAHDPARGRLDGHSNELKPLGASLGWPWTIITRLRNIPDGEKAWRLLHLCRTSCWKNSDGLGDIPAARVRAVEAQVLHVDELRSTYCLTRLGWLYQGNRIASY